MPTLYSKGHNFREAEAMNIEFEYGEKTLILKPPVIREKIIKRHFWFDKVEYYVDWEYCILGPFKTYKDANDCLPTGV